MTLQESLSQLFGLWREVADETIRCLGEQKAGLFVELYNDALAIQGAIIDAYPEEERLSSLVYADFTGLLKELQWFHVLFLVGNYPLLRSRLRHVWEWLFRAYHADTYARHNPGATDGPGPTLDDKNAWLMGRENKLNWTTLITPTLTRLFPASEPKAVEEHFKSLWGRLNRMVHPSGDLRGKLVGDSALLVRDAFDERWAGETLADAAEVFGVLYLAVVSRFPAILPFVLARPHTFLACPQLRGVLESARAAAG